LKFTNPVRPADIDKGMVYVRIEKTKGSAKITAKHVHVEGDRIGWWPETPDGEPVSIHPVTLPDGKVESVDFDTGLTLKSVVPAKKVLQVKRCKPVFARTGVKIACELCLENRAIECYEVIYGQGAGDIRVLVPGPNNLNLLCQTHERYPDFEFTAERGLEAHALLQQADQLWTTTPVAATEIYQRLLKEFLEYLDLFEVRKKVESRVRQADK
jgi:hypothetical protein